MQKPDELPPRRIRVLEIGGSHVTAASVDTESLAVDAVHGDIDGGADRESLLEAIARPARTALARAVGVVGEDDAPWAVAIPGPFDYEAGVGQFAGVGKFESLRGVDVGRELSVRLSVPHARIRFLNDAHAYGIGEWAYGDVIPADRMVCLTLGTGVGSVFLGKGAPVTIGPLVPRDGEVHYLAFDDRPLEDHVSSRAITAHFAHLTGAVVPVKDIAQFAAAGVPEARAVLENAMHILGVTLAPWLARFGATRLVIGGSMVRSWHLLEPPLRRALSEAADDLTLLSVRASALLDRAPLLGAARWRQREGT